jgi:hypothetical protein
MEWRLNSKEPMSGLKNNTREFSILLNHLLKDNNMSINRLYSAYPSFAEKKKKGYRSRVPETHAYNPSYLGG